jgi:hypothetical protein
MMSKVKKTEKGYERCYMDRGSVTTTQITWKKEMKNGEYERYYIHSGSTINY